MNFETFKIISILSFGFLFFVVITDSGRTFRREGCTAEKVARLEARVDIMMNEVAKINKKLGKDYERRAD